MNLYKFKCYSLKSKYCPESELPWWRFTPPDDLQSHLNYVF